ncbi:hypothetical protein [Nocardia puris]|uniref:Uncharacterized protein n=1 Tax=Nocardia puris TaxID=208602 RepID=A0A366DW82_9NOCA|nr:hypothetical protein [Nocardia puris]RBO94337.1 hypothetical protein DFR74_102760 [Nocardia puris]
MTVLDVSAQTYYDAADICAKASFGYFEAFKTAMRSFGDTTNMAGSVGDGKTWAESYDQQCRDIYTMSIDMVVALDGYAQVLKQAGYNHALADHDPNSGTPEPAAPNLNPSFTLSPQELVSLLVPPSAGGPGRGLVDDGLELAVKVGIPIPDGDTAKLSRSGDVWHNLANNASVTAAPSELERAAVLFEQVTSPDANFIDEDLRQLKTAASDLGGAYGELAQACRDQKTAHDELREDLRQLCEQLATEIATEVAVNLALSVVASAVSFGVGAAAVAAKTAVAVARIIDKFVDLIKAAVKAAKLRTAVAIERAGARTREIIQRIKELTTELIDKLKRSVFKPKNLQDLFENGRTPKASELEKYALEQGWTKSQTPNGPPKYTDENGIVRMTIKKGSSRAPGSQDPHVELRNANGERIDPFGNTVDRRSPGNHTPIDWDWQ